MSREERELEEATSYDAWRVAAANLDAKRGVNEWRNETDSRIFDATLLIEHTADMRRLREARKAEALIPVLQEALYRHLGELGDPRLYQPAYSGTLHVIEAFYAEAERCIEYLANPDDTGLSPERTLAQFQLAARIFGRSALLLSGGASLGFFHIGVIKALFEHGLLPEVLSGASMGAMVACGIGSRTDEELRELFADTSVLRTDALKRLPVRQARKLGAVYDPERLLEVIVHNNGDLTFGEAYAKTGRVVNVSISPTRQRQKPRILSYLTTPRVLMSSGAVASSSVPGAFPAATLQARHEDGTVGPYMRTEQWIDGSFKGDLPMRRLGRLHNVNHFIVSQVNPHVAPVKRVTVKKGVMPFLADMATSTARVQLTQQLHIAKSLAQHTPLFTPLDLAHSLADQSYSGDIDIHPRFRALALVRTFSNISRKELGRHILEGERATWPELRRIRDRTAVSRALSRAIKGLSAR